MRIITFNASNNVLPTQASELVPASKLFEFAAARFESALATSRIGGPDSVPSAVVAVIAIQQAEAGVRSLNSINVPTTPFDVRVRANRALDHARRGIVLMRDYHSDLIGYHPNHGMSDTVVTDETLAKLVAARRHLGIAIEIANGA